jgi:hypothetical protein
MQPSQKGFSHLLIPIIVVVLGVVGFVGWKVTAKNKPPIITTVKSVTASCKYNDEYIKAPRNTSTGAFTASLTNLGDIAVVTPGLGDSRFTYLQISPKGLRVPVYAPADGTLMVISYKHRTDLSAAEAIPDYDLSFMVSCDTIYRINHITDPIAAIVALRPSDQPLTVGGPNNVAPTEAQIRPKNFSYVVKAGQLIGTTTGTAGASNWDFGLFINQKATCPYTHFVEPIQSQWLAKLGDSTHPIAGTACNIVDNSF